MAIMTGRYSNKELRNDGYYPVGISVGKPRFSTGYEIREQCYALAPRYDMLKLGYEEYKAEYFKKLDKIGVDKIIGIVQRLDAKAQEEDKKMRTAMLTKYAENKEVRGIMKLVNRQEDAKNGYKLTYEAALVAGRDEKATLAEWLRREKQWQQKRAQQ